MARISGLACTVARLGQVHSAPGLFFSIILFFFYRKGFVIFGVPKMIFVKYGNCPHKYNAMFGTATKSLEEV